MERSFNDPELVDGGLDFVLIRVKKCILTLVSVIQREIA